MQCLNSDRYEAFYVGGCVRNALMGLQISDIDISTNAQPDNVIAICTAAGFKVIPTGIDHGTVTVIADHIPHEVTTYRRDVETDGRRAVVAYSDKIEDDARRRDFTMNALYADIDGKIIDPLGGLPDLQARRIRFIEDPDARIREDYLRILRFFRFHAYYGDISNGLDGDALDACARNAQGIDSLSKERIGSEIKKLLAAKDPGPSVAAMHQTGVLMQALPGADPKALYPLVHLDEDQPSDPIRRLAALGGHKAPDALRLSRAEAQQLKNLTSFISDGTSLAEIAYRNGAQMAQDVMLLRSAIFETPLAGVDGDLIDMAASSTFPVKSADLMDQFQGKDLGDKLSQLEDQWIKSGFKMTKAQLLSL
nr:CCA tRNA nucleotidyltransferase [Pseudaestuariivita rosea]